MHLNDGLFVSFPRLHRPQLEDLPARSRYHRALPTLPHSRPTIHTDISPMALVFRLNFITFLVLAAAAFS